MSKTIVIDPGHGGSDIGYTGNNLIEKDYALEISNYIANRLKELNIPYFEIRTTDKTLSSDERTNSITTKYGTNNDIVLISNHLNKGGEDGVEIIYQLKNKDTLSKKISDSLESNNLKVNKYYQLRDSTNTSKDYYPILRDTPNYESIMILYGYVDNISDANSLKTNIEKYGESVIKGLANYIGYKYSLPLEDNIYVVQKGDSLYKIANLYNTTIEDLKQLNNLSTSNLQIGQILKLPQKYDTYTVQKGDSLYKISNLYNTTVNNLKNINNLTNNILQIGQVLKVPKQETTYIVQKGDTLYKIATKYNTTPENIKKINNLSSNILSIGQVLKIF